MLLLTHPAYIYFGYYNRKRINLISLYLPLCDRWIVYNNSSNNASLVAEYNYTNQLVGFNITEILQIKTNCDYLTASTGMSIRIGKNKKIF
jgi:hypothetical protein